MGYSPGWKPGRWSAICDVCGFRFHSDRLQKRWDGLMVCHKDYETRHPQDFIKLKSEHITPPWTRPEEEDEFMHVCYLWSLSAYAGLGTAGCMVAGNVSFPYDFLLDLKGD